jgi:nascent polypeptide-associated complex subunit alpha
MFPGMNPRDMKNAMKRLGIQQQEIEATEVIIKTADKELVFQNPEVSKVNMMGQETWQIVGKPMERSRELFTDDDVKTVMQQSNVTEEEAKSALQESNGDLAEAILNLKK